MHVMRRCDLLERCNTATLALQRRVGRDMQGTFNVGSITNRLHVGFEAETRDGRSPSLCFSSLVDQGTDVTSNKPRMTSRVESFVRAKNQLP